MQSIFILSCFCIGALLAIPLGELVVRKAKRADVTVTTPAATGRIDAATLAKINKICSSLPTTAQSACQQIRDAINNQASADQRHTLIKQATARVSAADQEALEDAQMKIIGLVPSN